MTVHVTTLHNLTMRAEKRLRQISALNQTINALGPRETLTVPQKRSLTIAMRNLRRAMEELQTTRERIQQMVKDKHA